MTELTFSLDNFTLRFSYLIIRLNLSLKNNKIKFTYSSNFYFWNVQYDWVTASACLNTNYIKCSIFRVKLNWSML